MFRPRGFRLGAFAPTFMRRRSLVLQPHAHALGQRDFRTAYRAGSQPAAANLKEPGARAPFAIGDETEIAGRLNHLGEGLHRYFEEGPVFFTTVQFPGEPTRPVHQHDRPAFRLQRRDVGLDFRVPFIAFDELLQKLVTERVEAQPLFQTREPLEPVG